MKLAVIATLIASTAAFSVNPKGLEQVRLERAKKTTLKETKLVLRSRVTRDWHVPLPSSIFQTRAHHAFYL